MPRYNYQQFHLGNVPFQHQQMNAGLGMAVSYKKG